MDIMKVLETKESRLNFLKGLIRVAKCDKKLDNRELSFYQQAAYGLGLDVDDVEVINECWNTDRKIEITFQSSKEKMFFFIQAVQLCWIDNDYVDDEQKEMRVLATELGISIEALECVEKWAYEGIQWNRKGEDLLALK